MDKVYILEKESKLTFDLSLKPLIQDQEIREISFAYSDKSQVNNKMVLYLVFVINPCVYNSPRNLPRKMES
jgi:hypothetical protein